MVGFMLSNVSAIIEAYGTHQDLRKNPKQCREGEASELGWWLKPRGAGERCCDRTGSYLAERPQFLVTATIRGRIRLLFGSAADFGHGLRCRVRLLEKTHRVGSRGLISAPGLAVVMSSRVRGFGDFASQSRGLMIGR